MIEKELRKSVEVNEQGIDIVRNATMKWFNTNSEFQHLGERERAIVACQIVKELQKVALETYTMIECL